MVIRTEDGYALCSHFAHGEILFVDQMGHQTRTVGREGEGPG
jgi:hypothetical protein